MDPLPSDLVPIVLVVPRGWKSHAGRLARLVRKELSEILRDRRTMLTLVLMPILVYPLLTIAFQQHFRASALTQRQKLIYRVGYPFADDLRLFQNHLELGNKYFRLRNPEFTSKSIVSIDWLESADPQKDVDEGRIDLGFKRLGIRRDKNDRVFHYQAIYKEQLGIAQEILEYLEKRFSLANEGSLETRLGIVDRPPVWLVRLVLAPQKFEVPQRISLGALVPLILILMTITGAVYPAIDLTAGERERGTLEILVAAPVPRVGLLFAKYVTVFTVAVLTALVNLLTMLITLQVSDMGALVFGAGNLTFFLIMQMLGLLLLFAAFFSAALLAITSVARSFKEAQAYLIPLMLLSLTPGVMGMLPGLKLEGTVRAVPLLNIVLLARDLFDGHASGAAAVVVVVSTLLYSMAVLAIAARIFGAESVLFSEQRSWSDLWRRPPETAEASTLANALLCLALIFPAFFFLQGSFVRELPILGILLAMPVGSAFLFGVFPVISAWWNRVNWRSGFQLQPAPAGAYLGAALLGVSLWPLLLQVLALLKPDLPPAEEQVAELLATFQRARQEYFLLLMFAVVSQGLAEEWFFRGYLFAALRSHGGAWLTIGASALLFGFFHLVSAGELAFLSSTILGIVLGWVAWRSGSVFPGMALHALHNGILIWAEIGELDDMLPWSWVALGAAGAAAGLTLTLFGSRRKG